MSTSTDGWARRLISGTGCGHRRGTSPRRRARRSARSPRPRGGTDVLERGGDHRVPPEAAWIAFHTLCGEAGMGTSVTPRGAASAMALITAGAAPIVPASPMPSRRAGSSARASRVVGRDRRHVGRGRHEVVGERRRAQVAVLVVHGLLEQRLRDALYHAAMDLALDDERVDLHRSRRRRRSAACRPHPSRCRPRRRTCACRTATRSSAGRRCSSPRGSARPRRADRGVNAANAIAASGMLLSEVPLTENAAGEVEVLLRGLELVGGDLACLVHHPIARHVDGDAADGQRASRRCRARSG